MMESDKQQASIFSSLRRLPIAWVLLGGGSILGGIILHYATFWGPWAYSDSVEYLVSARSLILGRGLGLPGPSGSFKPLVLHPPFYSLILAALGGAGINLIAAARWLSIGLWTLTLLIPGALIGHWGRSIWTGLLLTALLLPSWVLLDAFAGAMAEGLFIFLVGLSIVMLTSWLIDARDWLLVLSGLAAGLSAITRYNGIVLAPTGLIAILSLAPMTWREKLKKSGLFALLALVPTLIWLGWLRLSAGIASPRNWALPEEGLWEALVPIRLGFATTVMSWVPFGTSLMGIRYRDRLLLLILLGVIFLGLIAYARHRWVRDPLSTRKQRFSLHLALTSLLAAISFVGLQVVTTVFSRPVPDSNDRTLAPLLFLLLLSFVGLLGMIPWKGKVGRAMIVAGLLFAFAYGFTHFERAQDAVETLHSEGRGYTSPVMRSSDTIRLVSTLPEGMPIVSNEAAFILLQIDRAAYELPPLPEREAVAEAFPFGSGSTSAEVVFREDGAALVLFDTLQPRLAEKYADEAKSVFEDYIGGLAVWAEASDGAIYFWEPNTSPTP